MHNLPTSGGGGGIQGYFSTWLRSIPLGTRLYMFLCAALYIYVLLFGLDYIQVCNIPILISTNWTYAYRFLTAPFFHAGILHILLNMFSYQSLGAYFERTKGTIHYIYLIFLFALGSSSIQFLMAFILGHNPVVEYTPYLYQCSVGFSAVLFCLLVIECHNLEGTRSLFGLISLRAKLYPWILLVVLQFIMPNLSFLGHLSGMLVGYLYIYDYLSFLQPSVRTLEKMESSPWVGGWLVMRDGYINIPNSNGLLPFSHPDSTTDQAQSIRHVNWLSWMRPGTPPTQAFAGTGYVLGTSTSSPSQQGGAYSAIPQQDVTLEQEPHKTDGIQK